MDVYYAAEDEPVNLWERFQWQFLEPTRREFSMIERFLHEFPLEDEGFNEEDDYQWLAFKESLGGAPDLRNSVLTLLHQIRRTKGYGVSIFIDFSRFPRWSRYGVFTPRDLDDAWFLLVAVDAGKAAVHQMNDQEEVLAGFEFLNVDELVTTNQNRLLLSFVAAEHDGSEMIKIVHLQAMIDAIGFSIDRDEGFPRIYRLREWKYKPFVAPGIM